MKNHKFILGITLIISLSISQSSCIVVHKKDNGKHKGWYKNSNNPHNPNTTNPGNGKVKSKGNSNGNRKK
ncbi:MAG: hypothetical protein V4677_17715 [Bacteroidota bacterium]